MPVGEDTQEINYVHGFGGHAINDFENGVFELRQGRTSAFNSD